MESPVYDGAASGHFSNSAALSWKDLRDWIALLEAHGQLKTITAPVDLDEELSAITLLASQQGDTSPALLFENIDGDKMQSRVLSNMLGASKERYALAVGLDPSLPMSDMIAASRDLMNRRLPPAFIRKDHAPVNEVILTGKDINLTAFPAPKFWPGRASRARSWQPTGSIRSCSWWRRRASVPSSPSSTSPAASWGVRSS